MFELPNFVLHRPHTTLMAKRSISVGPHVSDSRVLPNAKRQNIRTVYANCCMCDKRSLGQQCCEETKHKHKQSCAEQDSNTFRSLANGELSNYRNSKSRCEFVCSHCYKTFEFEQKYQTIHGAAMIRPKEYGGMKICCTQFLFFGYRIFSTHYRI